MPTQNKGAMFIAPANNTSESFSGTWDKTTRAGYQEYTAAKAVSLISAGDECTIVEYSVNDPLWALWAGSDCVISHEKTYKDMPACSSYLVKELCENDNERYMWWTLRADNDEEYEVPCYMFQTKNYDPKAVYKQFCETIQVELNKITNRKKLILNRQADMEQVCELRASVVLCAHISDVLTVHFFPYVPGEEQYSRSVCGPRGRHA
jgi:hypothetical protein